MKSFSIATVALLSFLAGALLFSGVSTRAADDKAPPRLRGQLYPKWRQLFLSNEQRQKIYKIQADYRTKVEALQKQIRQLKREERMEAEKVLTPAQRARLKELTGGRDDTPPPPRDKAPAQDRPAPKKDK